MLFFCLTYNAGCDFRLVLPQEFFVDSLCNKDKEQMIERNICFK